MARRGTAECLSASSRSICQSAYSPLSISRSCDGPNVASCRASSDPIVPPAPVTITRRPWISRAIASRSSGTCGRFSSSSIATGRSSSGPNRGLAGSAGRSAVGRGARRTVTPNRSASRTNASSDGPEISGLATASICGTRPSADNRSSTAPTSTAEPRIGWPWMRRPACGEPRASSPITRNA